MAECSGARGTRRSSTHLDLLGFLQEALARARAAVLLHDLSNETGEHTVQRRGVAIYRTAIICIVEAHHYTKERAPSIEEDPDKNLPPPDHENTS